MATQENTPVSPEISVNLTDVESPLLTLRIRRGKTRHPERPVFSENYLIGSGENCDLRLGGEEMPAAYAALVASEGEVRVQWFSEGPELLVNGKPIQEAVLQNGDRIHFGQFEFEVFGLMGHAAAEVEKPEQTLSTKDLGALLAAAKTTEQKPDLSQLSALEVMQRLEAEQRELDEFQDSIRLGQEALMFAAIQRAADLSEAEQPESAGKNEEAEDEDLEAAILEDLEKVIRQLNGVSSELDERAARLTNQEATQAEAAEMLLIAQNELASQLERFHQQIAESQKQEQDQDLDQEPPGQTLRKAA